jgi:hypothetical protein
MVVSPLALAGKSCRQYGFNPGIAVQSQQISNAQYNINGFRADDILVG